MLLPYFFGCFMGIMLIRLQERENYMCETAMKSSVKENYVFTC